MARIDAQRAGGDQVRAFLDTIAYAELGREMMAKSGDDGYNVLVGSTPSAMKIFASYDRHPNILVLQFFRPRTIEPARWQAMTQEERRRDGIKNRSTAAGRYQFIRTTFEECADRIGLKTFTPLDQDLAAVEMLRRLRALPEIQTGRIESAIALCAGTWESMPGAKAEGQPKRKLAELLGVYSAALGGYRSRPNFANVESGVASTAPTGEASS